MLAEHAILDGARRAANAVSSPARVMLFGSCARGDADEGSDLDLLVIETDVPDKAEEYLKLHRAIGSIGVGVDVLITLNAGDKSSQKRDIRRAINLAAELGEGL